MSAITELLDFLDEDEKVEAIVFGDWGRSGYNEPRPPPIPNELKRKVLTLEEATPLMQNWDLIHGYGSPKCYAINVYTQTRIIFVSQYDGSTELVSIARDPENATPSMPGG